MSTALGVVAGKGLRFLLIITNRKTLPVMRLFLSFPFRNVLLDNVLITVGLQKIRFGYDR